ncbi:Alpha/beta hydrolase family protein [Dyella sp. OK004]|uniref:esterase/lipase family protein n=1 Tax=Dyella sp. OK004 TaxID=1855292 RepID=UPI0008E9FCD8|nr:alpha/beta fold hydrolase [Dyella sp. OK004]SFS03575.1 Alpha/beta hydrolase family protein [Dyella sp. OK004]
MRHVEKRVIGALAAAASAKGVACRLLGCVMILALVACEAVRPPVTTASNGALLCDSGCSARAGAHDATLAQARARVTEALHTPDRERAARAWLRCAATAYRVAATNGDQADEAASLDTQCTGKVLDYVLSAEAPRWTAKTLDLAGDALVVELRELSPGLSGPPTFVRADEVPISTLLFGQRFATNGFGVSMVAGTPRCKGAPRCQLFPQEGVTRTAVAWIEWRAGEVYPHLVFANPMAHPTERIGARDYILSVDTTAPYAALASITQLKQLAIRGLIGGQDIGLRKGVYLLEDYDPHKIPIVMLHGLAASPLIWARLTNRIQGTPTLRSRYQVWHVIYPTDAPVLLSRLRVKEFLDRAWAELDPSGHDPSRERMVLVGHSMGGMIARLLAADSGDTVWQAALAVPVTQLHGNADDLAILDHIMRFTPYPGVDTAFFLATPHHGSPVTADFVGRLALWLVKPHSSELDALKRLIKANPDGFRPELLANYREHGLSSISTLSMEQPVSRAASTLMPVSGVRYYTIAGSLPGEAVPGDGIVPLESTFLPGAVSTVTVKSGHRVYRNDDALNLIVKVLGESPDCVEVPKTLLASCGKPPQTDSIH